MALWHGVFSLFALKTHPDDLQGEQLPGTGSDSELSRGERRKMPVSAELARPAVDPLI